ncbi:phosphoribosyltransferase [Polaromonas sp.]|uniref:phosphoribosyltransferase n=1 Tax=Polaromonas sp. TaxID=1869339 RepID=UPI002FC78C78
MTPFRDRQHGGQVLARKLAHYRGQPGLIVLALPRGGVPVAFEVATALRAPLDVLIVRKLGYPGQEEYAMGAITSGGVRVMNRETAGMVPEEVIEAVVAREQAELVRREQLYRGQRPALALENRTVILVDDGLATGSSMRAAVMAVKRSKPARTVVAVPVAALETCESMRSEVDELVCAMAPLAFHAVGLWYRDFPQTADEEVQALLKAAWQMSATTGRQR